MKKFLGSCLVGFGMLSAAGGAPLILDWGVLDTSSAEQQKLSQAVRTSARAPTVQRLSAQGTAPWLVQFDDVIQEDWKAALTAAGAKLKGYIPENAYLVEATPKQMAAIGALAHVVWVGEYLPEYKRAAKVRAKLARVKAVAEADEVASTSVLLFSGENLESVVQKIEALTGAPVAAAEGDLIRTGLTAAQVEEVTGWGEVQWVEPYTRPRLWNDVAVRTNLMGVTNAWSLLGLTGAGQTIAVCDTGMDSGNTNTLHRDFTNRVTGFGWSNGAYSSSYSWADYDSHGTHVAGSVLGNGTMSTGRYKGVAYQANLIFQGAQEDLGGIPTDLNSLFRQAFTNGARIHSDSWGYDDNGYYHTDSRNLDMFTWSNKTMLVLVAAGNAGTDANSDGIVDLDSIGSPATAKNCLTVGAAESDRPEFSAYTWGDSWPADFPANPIAGDEISGAYDNTNQGVAAFSSRGPCDDGRIKPDILAPGTDIISTRSRSTTNTGWGVVTANTNYLWMGGTSMATPLTAGAVGLTRQWVTTTGGITNPSGQLLKALLLNGARNMSPGQYGTGSTREVAAVRPSNVQGWGHIDLYNTLQPASNQFLALIDTNSLSTGQTNVFTYAVTSGSTNKFIATLAYADYWGTAGSGKQLINDLDLTVIKPGGTTNYANGRTSVDATNNVEMVELAADEAGTYTVKVVGRTVPSGTTQAYALVVRGPAADETPTAPVFGANPGPLGATTGVARAFTVGTTAGYPVPVLALQGTTASTGYTFTAGTGQLTYTPPVADVGARSFTFTASNSVGVATQVVAVTVSEAPPAAPGSIWASATNTADFTAAWSAVAGATGYRLDVGTNAAFAAGGAAASDLFISEYIEGSSNNKAVEIYNGTGAAVDLGAGSYTLRLYANGGTSPSTITLSGTLAHNDVFVIANTSANAAILAQADQTSGSLSFNGNDVVALAKSAVNIDVVGTIGSSADFALDVTKVRQSSVGQGTTTYATGEWTDYAVDTTSYLGAHTFAGGVGDPYYVPGYSNRTVAGTSQSVTGLASGATYYFRARAVNGGGASPNSATASVATLSSLSAPVFGANPGPVATTAGVDTVFAVSASGSPAPALALDSTTAAVDSYDFDAETGDVLYIPPQGDAGARTFTFTASNSQGVASQTVTVNVSAATAPVFTGGAGPYSTTAGVAVAFTVSASGAPAATLALAGTTASTGYVFTAGTGAFTYTPPEADVGTRTFTFTAANAAGTVTQVTSVGVAAVPAAPAAPAAVWASATNAAGFTAAWSAASGADSYRLDVGTNDTFTGDGGAGGPGTNAYHNGTLGAGTGGTWTETGLTQGSGYLVCLSGDVLITPAMDFTAGTAETLSFMARTYGGVVSNNNTITVSVSTNNGSSWASLGTRTPATATLTAMAPFDLSSYNHSQVQVKLETLGATASVGAGLDEVLVTNLASGATASYVPGYSNRTVAGTSEGVTGLVESATYYFRVRAVNAAGTSGNSPTGSVTTASNAPAGTAPVMDAIGAQVTSVGAEFEYLVTATEPDADPVAFACTSAVDGATWDFDANTGDFLFIPTTNQMGTNFFAFTATDKDGTSAPVQMSVKVYSAAATNDFTQWVEDEDEDPASSNFYENADFDGDGATTWEEYLADTDPNDPGEVLRLSGSYFIAAQVSNTTGQIRFSFPASTGRYYQLEYCTGLTNHLIGTTNLGWGVPGMVVTNDATGTWYGVIRALLQAP